ALAGGAAGGSGAAARVRHGAAPRPAGGGHQRGARAARRRRGVRGVARRSDGRPAQGPRGAAGAVRTRLLRGRPVRSGRGQAGADAVQRCAAHRRHGHRRRGARFRPRGPRAGRGVAAGPERQRPAVRQRAARRRPSDRGGGGGVHMSGWLPVALIAVPLLGALLLLVAPGALRPVLRGYGMAVSGVTLVLAAVMVAGFDHAQPARPQFTVDQAWIPGLDLRFHLGVDGISLPLVALTALLTFLCFAYLGWGGGRRPGQLRGPRARALVFTLLVLEVGMIGTFLALDLLLFFVFFEIVLVPMYFLIAIWGGEGRRAAAIKFILYTPLGSVVMLLGLLLIWAQTGTLDIVALTGSHGAGMS